MEKYLYLIALVLLLLFGGFLFQLSKFESNFSILKDNTTSFILKKGRLPKNQLELEHFEKIEGITQVCDYFSSVSFEGIPTDVRIQAKAYFSSGTHDYSLTDSLPSTTTGN